MNNLSTMSFFMALNETEIARQLTLIDFKIFEAIEVITSKRNLALNFLIFKKM